MKVIKAKPNQTSATIHSLLKRSATKPEVERVLVVYGEGAEKASIYYEAPAAPKPAVRP